MASAPHDPTSDTSPPAPELVASYATTSPEHPSAPFTLRSALPSSSADKTSYLRALRTAVTNTQAQINEALTSRMEEDKQRDAEAAIAAGEGSVGDKKTKKGKKGLKIDDEAEEMNYGEEVVEED